MVDLLGAVEGDPESPRLVEEECAAEVWRKYGGNEEIAWDPREAVSWAKGAW
jgi:hypothetical protein